MVAVSATLPNVQDIAAFLEAPPENTFFFGPEFRPVPLKTIVKGCGRNSNEFFFDKNISNFVPPAIYEHGADKPAPVPDLPQDVDELYTIEKAWQTAGTSGMYWSVALGDVSCE